MWPFKRKPEKRNYTDTITSAFLAAAQGEANEAPLATAAVESAAGLYARCLAAADVEAAPPFKRAITPSVLAQIGRDMIRSGNSYHLINVVNGRLELRPQSHAHARGASADPLQWSYESTEAGPTDSVTRLVSATQMIHCRYAVDRSRSWEGQAPWSWARSTSGAISGLDNLLSRETRGPHGHLLSIPESPQIDEDGDIRPLDGFRNDLAKAKGGTLILETPSNWSPSAGVSGGRSGIDKTELGLDRSLIDSLRTSVGRDVLAAAGVPPSLFQANADGTAQRESFRRFLHSSLTPLTRLVEQELSMKLETEIRLDLSGLNAADIAGKARAFGQLTKGGMSKKQAKKVTGLNP